MSEEGFRTPAGAASSRRFDCSSWAQTHVFPDSQRHLPAGVSFETWSDLMQKPLYIRKARRWTTCETNGSGMSSITRERRVTPAPLPRLFLPLPRTTSFARSVPPPALAVRCGAYPWKPELGPPSQKTLQKHLLLAEQLARNSCLGDQNLPGSHAPLLPFRHGKVLFLSPWFYFNSSCFPFHNKENTRISQETLGYFKSFHLSAFLVAI